MTPEMSTCPGCGGVVGRDCWNPEECEWISRDMASRHAAQQEMEQPLSRIDELERRIAALEHAYATHGHTYAACYGPGGEWDRTAGPVDAKTEAV